MTDYLDRLAAFVEGVAAERLRDTAARAARLVLLDTLGAMVAGSAQPENRRLAQALHERRSRATATLVGHAGKADPLLATFVNATAGVALEVDEGSRLGGGHPAIHVIPGALAVAEDLGADGGRLLESIIAGYEVCSRLGGATTPRPNVHSHGTWGTIGTAVAVAKLAGLDAAGVAIGDQSCREHEPRQYLDHRARGGDDPERLPGALRARRHPRGGSPSRGVHRAGRRAERRLRHDPGRPLRARARARRPRRAAAHRAELLQALRVLPVQPLRARRAAGDGEGGASSTPPTSSGWS